MKAAAWTALAAIAALTACHQARQSEAPPAQVPGGEPPMIPATSVNEATKPAANEASSISAGTLPEPKGPIDPRSVEAAGQVVQHYGALVERSRFLQAERLWADVNAARAFATALDGKFKDVHLEIGNLGATEGAAGSIYTEVPAVFYGQSEQGKALRLPAAVVLRRVNDVPGSTERQRRWHIERIDWRAAARAG